MAMVILWRGNCGLSKCITRYLVAMAAADLMVVVIEVIFYQIVHLYTYVWVDKDTFLTDMRRVPYCLVHYTLCNLAIDCSVWFSVAFTFDRCVFICFTKLKRKYCTPKFAGLVIGTICFGLCIKNIPFYFLYQDILVKDNHNIRVCSARPVILWSLVFNWFYWMDQLLNPVVPFYTILTLNVLTARQIVAASRVRHRLRGQRNCEKQRDPEMVSRRKSIILLFLLSASFLLCWATSTLVFILTHSLYLDLETSISLYLARERGAVFQLFSCCTNTFIYGVIQTKFREQLKIVLLYPAHWLFQISRSSSPRR
ncbi:G-protein coupled receptor 15-like [Narcine bancroftii]|uniref:G-protein coupled receptor 15-like n=1 Tax=Narcine bancroftii TaxID=1343680 RepID=UPI00383156B3